jgi:hypothetical protein
MVEVLDLCRRERLAEDRHPCFPFRFADDGQALNVFPMLEVELQIFPQNARRPAVEVVHFEQDANLTVLLNLFVHNGCEGNRRHKLLLRRSEAVLQALCGPKGLVRTPKHANQRLLPHGGARSFA